MKRYYYSLVVFLVVQTSAHAAPRDALVESMSIASSKHGRHVDIKVRAVPACNIADLDIIARELFSSEDPSSIILSVESLDSGHPIKPTVFNLSKEVEQSRQELFNFTWSLDQSLTKGALGLFICKVKNGTEETCRNKEIKDFNELLVPHRDQIAAEGREIKYFRAIKRSISDKIYYFTPLVVSDSKLSVLHEEPNDQSYHELGKGSDVTKEGLETIQKLDRALKSYPPLIESNALVIRLPYYDATKCGH